MLTGQIIKLEDGYWLEMQHGMLKLMFRLEVRGVVATRALKEAIERQEGIFLQTKSLAQVQEMVKTLDKITTGARAATVDINVYKLLRNVEETVDKYRTEG